jgi:2-haloalkanoic acid dehalogenase type II
MTRLTGIRACVFDAYGTIFDFASAAARCPDVPAEQRAALTALWRDKQLQYTWLRTLQGRYADFWQVTGDALDFALDSLGLATPALRRTLMDLYLTLSAFPDVPRTLRTLQERGFTTAILSNGAPAMLAAAVRAAGLETLFDTVLSVDAVGVFKTHRGPTSTLSTNLASPRGKCASSPPTAGMPTPPPTSACVWSGATATARSPSASLARRTTRSAASRSCPA